MDRKLDEKHRETDGEVEEVLMADTMSIEILEDGTISVTTDKISDTNHVSADEFLAEVEKLAGGVRNTAKRKNHYHTHVHNGKVVVHAH